MPRIFVSHASADDAAVDTLSDWLTGTGHEDHFVDHKHIAGGGSWDAALRRESARAEMLILYVTPAWLASEECFAEYRASFYGDKTVLPLLLDGLRAQDLPAASCKRYDTLCASVQGIPIATLPPEGFTAEQIATAITRVSRAARAARRQRLVARGVLICVVLVATVLGLGVTNAAYVGDVLAAQQVSRSFSASEDVSLPFRDCDALNRCPEMIPIPAARYEIGYVVDVDLQPNPSEMPVQEIEFSAFAISRFETTKAQWRACVLATKHADPGKPKCKELVYSEAVKNEPVETVSWQDAQGYIAWLNSRVSGAQDGPYRLPSEAEWEYAARSGVMPRRMFSWEGGLQNGCDYANMLNTDMPEALDVRRRGQDCARAGKENAVMLSPVGTYRPNENFGLYDTAGNVSEWVADCWHESHAQRPTEIGGGAWISDAPADCDRVLKGGSWIGLLDLLRPSARVGLDPDVLGFNIGFRVARDID